MSNPIDNAIKSAANAATTGALGELNATTLPQAQGYVETDIVQISNVLNGTLLALQGTVDSALAKIEPVLGAADELRKLLAKINAGEKVTVTFQLGGGAS